MDALTRKVPRRESAWDAMWDLAPPRSQEEIEALVGVLAARNDAVVQPPAEQHTAAPGTVWDLVVRDMHSRDALGLRKYGKPLRPHDGRDALLDAYEEALDLAVYLRKAMLERDGK